MFEHYVRRPGDGQVATLISMGLAGSEAIARRDRRATLDLALEMLRHVRAYEPTIEDCECHGGQAFAEVEVMSIYVVAAWRAVEALQGLDAAADSLVVGGQALDIAREVSVLCRETEGFSYEGDLETMDAVAGLLEWHLVPRLGTRPEIGEPAHLVSPPPTAGLQPQIDAQELQALLVRFKRLASEAGRLAVDAGLDDASREALWAARESALQWVEVCNLRG